ncbi:ribonuclease H-like domain-containing protein [Tanacetum coccineum]
MVCSMWLFKHTFDADGNLSRYKARLVANGSSQQLVVDFDGMFSLVIKPTIVRTVLSLAISRKWPIHQLDVKNAFLNGDLSETVYMHQPPGFVDNRYPHHGSQVAYPKLKTLIFYNASNVTYLKMSLLRLFPISCLLYYDVAPQCYHFAAVRSWECDTYLLIYVDDIILTASYPTLLQQIIGLFLSQKKYALQLLERAHMGTMDFGLQLYVFATTSLVGYIDADWAGCPSTRSVEAEYRGVANVVAETAWIRNLLRELHSPLSTATLVYCDNVSVVYMSANPVQRQRMKHIEIDIHFVRDMVTAGHVRVLHVPSRFQYADIFNKGLPTALFEDFRFSLSVRPHPAQTAGAY